MPKKEQDQLSHLAEMYSLHMQLNDSPKKGVTLTKTELVFFFTLVNILYNIKLFFQQYNSSRFRSSIFTSQSIKRSQKKEICIFW